MKKRAYLIMLAFGIICANFAPATHADPVTFGFYGVTSNLDAIDPDTGDPIDPSYNADAVAPQLFVDVFNGDNTVKFLFRNEGSVDSCITDIYFADGTLLGIDEIIDRDNSGHTGVDFEAPATPGHLPGAPVDFVETTSYFSVDSDAPPSQWGVNEFGDEWVQINFDLLPGLELEDVLAAISDRSLQIGLHVQSIEAGLGDSSESFVNYSVPEPATLALLAIGFGFLRRKSRCGA